MRVFVAGASGVMGARLVPLLIGEGHEVAAMTRSPEKVDVLAATGAAPVVCDVFDEVRLHAVIGAFEPEVVMHQLTDLPDDPSLIPSHGAALIRVRRQGTDNLIGAACAAGVARLVAQSVAWSLPGRGGEAIAHLEKAVLAFGGVVLRYGQWFGPGTYHSAGDPPPKPRVHIDDAAAQTVTMVNAASGVYNICDD